jgi:hypothetical protein
MMARYCFMMLLKRMILEQKKLAILHYKKK